MAKAFDLTHEELVMIFNEIDTNGDGTIEIDEWLNFILKTSNKNFIKKKFVDKLNDKEWVENLDKIAESEEFEKNQISEKINEREYDLDDLFELDNNKGDGNDGSKSINSLFNFNGENKNAISIGDTKTTAQGTQNGMILLNLKSKITKLLTSNNLLGAVPEENTDFLKELKDILSNHDSDSEKALSSRSESVKSDTKSKKLMSKRSKS